MNLDFKYLTGIVDHTLLSPTLTYGKLEKLCDEAIEYSVASVCIPPCYVSRAKEYVDDRMKICTVIGFPNGYNTTFVKKQEALEALKNGADEFDMVINISWLKDKKYDDLLKEISDIKNVIQGKVLKVIIETCLLTTEEKIKMCSIVTESGADFIKTSTGFSFKGATVEDIELLKSNVGKGVKVKAAGGISSLEDAKSFISAGADRLGSSKIINLIKKKHDDKGSTY
jgi:deoxyribose-phosphate aldolase